MKMITIYFERKKSYRKLLKVYKNSVKKIMPKMRLQIIKCNKVPKTTRQIDAAYAFLVAAEEAKKSKELCIITDVDLMFLKSISNIKKFEFDIAITTRKSNLKYNTGLWVYRPGELARRFLNYWIRYTNYLMMNYNNEEKFIMSHGGIDQASLHMAMQNRKGDENILELPCQEWNATQSEWHKITENTRVIHVKSKLRSAVFGRIEKDKIPEYLKPLIKKWKGYLNDSSC